MSRRSVPTLEIWFVGIWVRDKVTGVRSADVDVTLSMMEGKQFADALEDFYGDKGARYRDEAHKLGVPSDFRPPHIHYRTPETSWRLETRGINIFGVDVNFVSLRVETWVPHLVIPKVKFGTADQDAHRRDATINAVFYNLDKQQLEDFTGKGL